MKTLKELYEESRPNTFYHGSPWRFDKFDISKVGTGDERDKFGWGLYFTDTEATAIKYAKDLTLSKIHDKGLNVYEVRLSGGVDNFLPWREEMPDWLVSKLENELIDDGYETDAGEMTDEIEEYGDKWSMESLYDWLSVVVGGRKEASRYLYELGVDGIVSDSVHFEGNVYVTFTDENIKIINRYTI